MNHLFSELKIREITFKNRIFVSPMCQYSCEDGIPGTWHIVHLGSRAVGGAALVMAEATAVSAEGRISPQDTGLWTNAQIEAFRPITAFIQQQGAVPGVQLAHAGRKASTRPPWMGRDPLREEEGGWQTLAPSAVPFSPDQPAPREMTPEDIDLVIRQFGAAAENARKAGFRVVEIHMAHGYLLHEFLSPLSNFRDDQFGGSFDNRIRFPLAIAKEVRAIWPAEWPVLVRISSTDWKEGGWDIGQSVKLSEKLKKLGIDLIDCSSGGILPDIRIPASPGYQTAFAAEIRQKAEIKTGAVGMITDPHQAEHILVSGQADAVFLARQFLRDPYWPLTAAMALGADIAWPVQYQRAKIK